MEGRWADIRRQPATARPTPPPRPLRRPWRVEVMPGCYQVRDRDGFLIVSVYWKAEPALHHQYLSRDEARRVAANIARLPDLVLADRARRGIEARPAPLATNRRST